MTKKKMIWLGVAGILSAAAIIDAIRYLKPDAANKQTVQSPNSFAVTSAKEIILVYNAYGGIYPGAADFLHKIISPSTYPCNLCYISFGTFGMKPEWKQFLDSLPYQKKEIHKDQFKNKYQPEDLPLPVIMISDGANIQLLASAAELNQCKTLQQLKDLVRSKLPS